MGMRGLSHVLRVCGAGLFIAVAAPMALAASDHAPSSGASKAATASATHHDANAARPRHGGKPAPHKSTSNKEHKQDLAAPATGGGSATQADKSQERRSSFGSLSLGVETDPKVKPRSLAGGEMDFDREPGVRSKYEPWFLGLSVKSPFSW